MMAGAVALWAWVTADAVIIPKLNVDAVKQRSQSEAQIDGVWVERDNNEPRHSTFLRFEPANNFARECIEYYHDEGWEYNDTFVRSGSFTQSGNTIQCNFPYAYYFVTPNLIKGYASIDFDSMAEYERELNDQLPSLRLNPNVTYEIVSVKPNQLQLRDVNGYIHTFTREENNMDPADYREYYQNGEAF